jgi:WD40 repeat protein
VETGKEVVDLVDSTRSNSVLAIALSRDGKTLAIGGESPWIRFIDLATGKEVATLSHAGAVFSLAFSPDGKALASGSADETIKLWEVAPAK